MRSQCGTIWYEKEKQAPGAVRIAWQMSKLQRLACKVMAGGLRSTSTDALDYHANVLSTHLRMNLSAYKSAAHLCSLPLTHPLQKVAARCKRVPQFHRLPIHHLMTVFQDLQDNWEMITPGKPDMTTAPTLEFEIADLKKSAEQDVTKLPKGRSLHLL